MGSQIFLLFIPSSAAYLWAAGGRSQKLVLARMPILVVNPRRVSAASPEPGILRGSCHKGDGNSCCWCPGGFMCGVRVLWSGGHQKQSWGEMKKAFCPGEWISFSTCIWAYKYQDIPDVNLVSKSQLIGTLWLKTTKSIIQTKQTTIQCMYMIQTKPPENKYNIPVKIYLKNHFPVPSQSLVSTCATSR